MALCLLIPAVGLAFLLWYMQKCHLRCGLIPIISAWVNSYLPDVYDPDRFFVPDVLTRIPINIWDGSSMWSCLAFPLPLTGFWGL
mgnify:CR=1 FL=1